MEELDTVIAVPPDHAAAESAIKRLAQAGFDLNSLSLVGNGYTLNERAVGFAVKPTRLDMQRVFANHQFADGLAAQGA